MIALGGYVLAERLDCGADVRRALGARLALDDERPAVADLLQGRQETLHRYLPGTEGHFLAPLLARLRRGGSVLHVDVPDVPAEGLDGFDRVARAVEDHVRRVEIDEDVRGLQVFEKAKELRRRLLARLHSQLDAVL